MQEYLDEYYSPDRFEEIEEYQHRKKRLRRRLRKFFKTAKKRRRWLKRKINFITKRMKQIKRYKVR